MTFTIPHIELPEPVLKTAERITLADLLDCPATCSDTISLISNFSKHAALYASALQPVDQFLEVALHRINNALRSEQREAAFAHLTARRKLI